MPPFLKTKYVIMMPKHFICGSTRNIYFTKHDIYFTDKMFILPNTDLEYKLVIRNKYLFHQTLLYTKKTHTHTNRKIYTNNEIENNSY